MKTEVIIQKFTDALGSFGFCYVLFSVLAILLLILALLINAMRVGIVELRQAIAAYLIRRHQRRILNTKPQARKIENLKNFN